MQIAVFCSSSNDLAPVYYEEADRLGAFIGKEKFTLVYGGANKGLMETLAKRVKAESGTVIGVLPSNMRKQATELADELFFVDSLTARKEMLKEYADIFVVLPGGFGTLDEMFDVLADALVGAHEKKLIIVNTNGFYDSLISLFDKFFTEKFAVEAIKKHFFVADSAFECTKYLKDSVV